MAHNTTAIEHSVQFSTYSMYCISKTEKLNHTFHMTIHRAQAMAVRKLILTSAVLCGQNR